MRCRVYVTVACPSLCQSVCHVYRQQQLRVVGLLLSSGRRRVLRGKSGPALGGTEYRLMPSACRLIVRRPLWNLQFRYLVSRAPMRRRSIVVVSATWSFGPLLRLRVLAIARYLQAPELRLRPASCREPRYGGSTLTCFCRKTRFGAFILIQRRF